MAVDCKTKRRVVLISNGISLCFCYMEFKPQNRDLSLLDQFCLLGKGGGGGGGGRYRLNFEVSLFCDRFSFNKL